MTAATTVQYRIVIGKKDERVEGADDATVVVSAPLVDVVADGFDPAVAFMQGRVKATGSTGALFALLRSGAAADGLSRLAGRP